MRKNTQKQVRDRLSRIEGQVRGLRRMVDENAYCVDIITQSSAIRNALSAVEDIMLENHLVEHVTEQIKNRKEKEAIQEIMTVFKKS